MEQKSCDSSTDLWNKFFWDQNQSSRIDCPYQKDNSAQESSDHKQEYCHKNMFDPGSIYVEKQGLFQDYKRPFRKRSAPSTNESGKKQFQTYSSEKNSEEKQSDQNECSSKKIKQTAKQNIYSKNYRDKKKQKFKILQQQNLFLKKKIDDLHVRLREAQMELNRVKHNLPEQKKSLLEINHIWLSKIKQLLQTQTNSQEQLYKDFSQSYDIYGFAGKQKMDKLQYHMGQFLQNVLKDSQKYMALTVINDWGLLAQGADTKYSQINHTVFQIMEYDQIKLQAIKKYLGPFLKPSMQKLQNSCRSLYLNFKNIINQINGTHEYLKGNRDSDFLSLKQRLQMQNWFQANKYSKQLRKLRADWIDSLQQWGQDLEPKKKKERKPKQNSQNKQNK